MHNFLRKNSDAKIRTTCKISLWQYSRHPNYLGEILIWLGVALALVIPNLKIYYYGFGWLIMVFLLEVISIPLMEKRQLQKRSDYELYRKTTSRLLLLPQRKIK